MHRVKTFFIICDIIYTTTICTREETPERLIHGLPSIETEFDHGFNQPEY